MLFDYCKLLRYLILVSTTTAGTGHPTSSLSAVELMTTLMLGGYFSTDLQNPSAHNNDRLIFSKGHACPLLYSIYTVLGVVSLDQLKTLRQFDSVLEGHPTMRWHYTEAATGSLGQGLGIGVGMAINAKKSGCSYRTWVLLGDSEMAEGSIWEAMMSASYNNLDNLVAVVDINRLGQRGETMYGHDIENYKRKCSAFGWEVYTVDGHNLSEIQVVLDALIVSDSGKPKIILAKTFKGRGISFLENQDGWHGKALSGEQCEKAVEELGEINLSLIGSVKLTTPVDTISQHTDIGTVAFQPKKYAIGEKIATRKSYGENLLALVESDNSIMVLDGEMNNSTFSDLVAHKYPERFIECFIAEQNMVSVATGLSRRGKKPYLSTFAAFLSRAFDQIRMAQYSQADLKIMGSHAGVSIGQDGSSQMAVEDIAMMRAIHGSVVLYPSDSVSTGKLLGYVNDFDGISYMRCTRAETPVIYDNSEDFVIGGSKTLFESDADMVTVFAAGITLHEGIKAYNLLKVKGINIRVIDLYSIKPLDKIVITKACAETAALIVVEDHYVEGGVYESVCGSGVATKPIYSLAVTKMSRSGRPEELLRYMEIDAQAIVELVEKIVHS
jgi:transketolase